MSNFPYIGCKISLISKHGIRYQGVLFSIHAEDHTICLNSVRCFGTEGRRAKDNLPEVPAAQDVFEYIVFRGSDIQDLTVCEATTPVEAPSDPAIVSTNQAPPGAPAAAPAVQSVPAPKPASPKGARAERAPAPRPRGGEQRQPGNGSLEGTGAYSMTRKAKAGEGEAWKAPTEEFDFAKALDSFDKDGLSTEFEDKLDLDDEGSGNFYQKSSFFDNISCDATDRETSEIERKNKGFAEMRKLDLETFGETFGRSHFRYRGKGGGGKGGGKGGGEGKGGNGSRGGRNRRRNNNNRQGQPSGN
eukprot:TRINITY_DN14042_c0_g1_i2.p1 TRINITY_DN14042_c0_g1~~TRINITY_DN14042_c0_g1_i2.p1  ORF type:complete len:302 (-),score=46.61 TRINITY_DN14042_c0_g1_i2:248-1153(-)